jgi:hypothetical protein
MKFQNSERQTIDHMRMELICLWAGMPNRETSPLGKYRLKMMKTYDAILAGEKRLTHNVKTIW